MKKIIFFGTPAYGHMISVAPVIRKLVNDGYDITWHTAKKYESIVNKSGARFEEYKFNFNDLKLDVVTSDLFELNKNLININQEAYEMYIDLFDYSDCVILYDSMCSFAKNIARKKGIKSICLVTTIAFNLPVFVFSNLFFSSIKLYLKNFKAFLKLTKNEKIFRKKYGLPKLNMIDLFLNKGDKTIVFSPKELQPFCNSFDKSFHFVGTTIKDRPMFSNTEFYQETDFYISLGSIFTSNKDELNRITKLEEFNDSNAVITIGKANLSVSNQNIRLADFTNQIEMLKRCKYFINHGGLNSVYESVYYGIPQICYPQQQEQKLYSKIVQRKHLGVYMKKIDDKYIRKIKKEKNISNIGSMRDKIKSYDGTEKASQIIKEYFK